jgi:hypothetical protein
MTITDTTKPDSNEIIAGLLDQINKLNTDLAQERANTTTATQKHLEDISLIGEKLMGLAEDHGWCSEYDEAVNEINAHLNISLPVRSKKHYLTVTLDIEFECEPDQATSLADEIARDFKYSSARVGGVDYEVVDASVDEITG